MAVLVGESILSFSQSTVDLLGLWMHAIHRRDFLPLASPPSGWDVQIIRLDRSCSLSLRYISRLVVPNLELLVLSLFVVLAAVVAHFVDFK